MADLNDDLIRELTEAINALKDAQKSGDTKKIDKATSRVEAANKKLEKAVDLGAKSIKEVSKSLDAMDKRISKGKATWQEMLDKSKQYTESLDDLNETSNEAIAVKKRVNALENEAAKKATSDMKAMAFKTAFDGAKKMVSGAGMEFVNGLQSGKTGISMATDLAVTAANITGDTLGGVGKNVTEVGASFATAGGKVGTLGKAAVVAGMALSTLGGAAKLMGLAGTVLGKEIEKTITAFNAATSAGALYAGGMTELRDTAHSAGLTVTNFANVLKTASPNLAQLGLSVPEATKKMGLAMKAGGDDMKRKMLNLGYSFEEQATLVAETMQSMKGTGGPLKATSDEIATETQKYAENLKVISAMTGEDVKKRQESVKAEMNTLAMQQKMASMPEPQRLAMQKSMENMDDVTRKAFIEMQLFGTTVTKGSAIMMASSGGFSSRVNELNAAANRGALDEAKTREINAKTAEQSRKDMMAQTGIAQAAAANASGIVGEVAPSMAKYAKDVLTQTPEALAAAEKATKGQMTADDKLTNSITRANIAGQNLAVSFENRLTPAIGAFASALETAITKIDDIVKSMGGEGGSSGMDMANLALTGAMVATTAAPLGKKAYDKFLGKKPPTDFGGASGDNYSTSTGTETSTGRAKRNTAYQGSALDSASKSGKFGKISKLVKGASVGGLIGGLLLDTAGEKAKEAGHVKTGAGIDIASDALTGASMGAILGPIGAALGGAAGGAYGLYKNWDTLTGKTPVPPPTTEINGVANMTPKVEEAPKEENKAKTAETAKKEEESAKKDETNIKLLTDLNKNVKSLENIMADISRFTRENRDISEKLYRETT